MVFQADCGAYFFRQRKYLCGRRSHRALVLLAIRSGVGDGIRTHDDLLGRYFANCEQDTLRFLNSLSNKPLVN